MKLSTLQGLIKTPEKLRNMLTVDRPGTSLPIDTAEALAKHLTDTEYENYRSVSYSDELAMVEAHCPESDFMLGYVTLK